LLAFSIFVTAFFSISNPSFDATTKVKTKASYTWETMLLKRMLLKRI